MSTDDELDTDKYMLIPASQLKPGMFIDLEDDPFATTSRPGASEQEIIDNQSTIKMLLYEYAVVSEVEEETPDCVVIHSELISFACPPYHRIKVATHIAEMPDGGVNNNMSREQWMAMFDIDNTADNN
jgi:hypothetical protein